jgi:hypothetical protein
MDAIFVDLLRGQGLPFIMSLIALAWMQRLNQASMVSLQEERNCHLKTLGEQINALEKAITECEDDRKQLWVELMKQNGRV